MEVSDFPAAGVCWKVRMELGSCWERWRVLLSDESEMKSGKNMALVKGVWEFCSYLFGAQRRPKEDSVKSSWQRK